MIQEKRLLRALMGSSNGVYPWVRSIRRSPFPCPLRLRLDVLLLRISGPAEICRNLYFVTPIDLSHGSRRGLASIRIRYGIKLPFKRFGSADAFDHT
jgi:hypothetical protein